MILVSWLQIWESEVHITIASLYHSHWQQLWVLVSSYAKFKTYFVAYIPITVELHKKSPNNIPQYMTKDAIWTIIKVMSAMAICFLKKQTY